MSRVLQTMIPLVVALSAALAAVSGPAAEETQKGTRMSYGEVRAFLAKHTELVELTNPEGARVAVCPEWQGRVMTSTTAGMDGPSFGFVNEEFIREGKPNPHFNNYGGEERMWLSPEGGQFSLWFDKIGPAQSLDIWFTPPAFNEGAWKIVSAAGEPIAMATTMNLKNASGTPFHLDVRREVRLLGVSDLGKLFGAPAAAVIGRKGVKLVAYETNNRLTNRGAAMSEPHGLVSIWILGMLNSGPKCAVIVPYKDGDAAKLGPIVKSDYFGPVPAERLKVLPAVPGAKGGDSNGILLFRGDGNYRSKIGISQRRARNVLGSIDFELGVLTLVNFTMPADPTKEPYMNNMWGGPHADPYVGDVVNSYNDGPLGPGKKGLGPFYEVESLSPTRALAPGQSLVHCHRTIHVQADLATLDELARQVLGVDLETVRKQMLAQ